MKENPLIDASKKFAVEIFNLCSDIRKRKKGNILINQLLRSGTSIGANIHEANYASGRADFINKLQIALKECYETEYWLELFKNTATISVTEYNQMMLQCNKIRRLLSASVNTAKENQRQAQKMNGSFGT
ncbi:MAG: four helix bundle protein [Ruminococcus sp.]|nr:four helix bundle protein [Ruminococcus sp.]